MLERSSLDVKKLRSRLRSLDCGSLEILVRGVDKDPDVLRKKLAPIAPPTPRPASEIAQARAEAFDLSSFRLGQTARPVLPRFDAPATPAERLSQQPVRMDTKTHRRMKQGKLSPEARLDLHGMTLALSLIHI